MPDLEKFTILSAFAGTEAGTPTSKQVTDMIMTFCDFGTLSCQTYGLTEQQGNFKRREYDCIILSEVAANLPTIPDTEANAITLRQFLNGHPLNTVAGQKALREIVLSLPEENKIRQAVLTHGIHDPDLSQYAHIAAIPKEEYKLLSTVEEMPESSFQIEQPLPA